MADVLSCFSQRNQAKDETLKDENSQIFYHLQTSLTTANIASFSLSSLALAVDISPLYQVFIYKTYVLPRLYQFWTQLQGKLAHKGPYRQYSIGGLRLRLLKLQAKDHEA